MQQLVAPTVAHDTHGGIRRGKETGGQAGNLQQWCGPGQSHHEHAREPHFGGIQQTPTPAALLCHRVTGDGHGAPWLCQETLPACWEAEASMQLLVRLVC